MSARDATRTYCRSLPFEMTAAEIAWNVQAQHPARQFNSKVLVNIVQGLVSTVLQRRKGLEKGKRGKYFYSRASAFLLSAFCFLLCTGCSSPHYAGTNVGMQTVSPFSRYRLGDETVSAYSISFFQQGPVTWHVQPIIPVDGTPAIVGVGADIPLAEIGKLFKP